MSGKSKMAIMRVAVCGLTSSSYNGLGGQGPGKSCLCNRMVQPTFDQLHLDHTSVLNLSEFGSNVINNTHFLYWGEKITTLEDGQEVKFQIVEHTEFVDDSSLKPFSTTKPYHKRCIQLKLQSGGKVAYIEPNQLALPENYTDVHTFPDKFTVDGFILCVDVSTKVFDEPSDPQKEFFDRLLQALLATKKPVVVACTKFDRAKPSSVASVGDIVGRCKKAVPMVEVSAVKGVNVDTCFLVLAHLVDTRKPKTRIVSYADSKAQLDERIRRNEEAFQYVLDERLVDFSMSLEDISKTLKPIVEYQILIDLCGQNRVNKLIQAKLNYLKIQLVKSKTTDYLKVVPHILVAMLPDLELEATKETTITKLRRSSKYEKYFMDVSNWKENVEFLKSSHQDNMVPFAIMEEEQGQEMLGSHIDEVLAGVRARAAAEKIKQTLNSTTDILPGVDMTMLWVDLGLTDYVKRISTEEQVQIYNEYMGKLEQECVADLTELFLEHSDLFDQISSSPKDTFDRVHQELKSVPRYKRLDHRSQLRMSQALKHIGSLQMPERSPVYGKSGLQDAIDRLLETGVLRREELKPENAGGGACWEVLSPDCTKLHLCILARTESNAITLHSDFMNHSGSGEVEIGDKSYEIEMTRQHGHHIHSLNTDNFMPHGAVAVVTSAECIDWLEDLVERLWLFEAGTDKINHAPCRGMPLIVLALDKDAAPAESSVLKTSGSDLRDLYTHSPKTSSVIHTRAQAIAGEVQCVCIAETPTTQPMRLVVSPVIHQILLALDSAFSHLHSFLTGELELKDPTGFNIAVCTLVGDPYPNEALLRPLLQHQLVCCENTDHTLFLRSAIEKQSRTCVLTFNSMFNVPALLSSIHLGFILVYSTQRPASLAVLKYLLAKLPNIPKLIVAMTASQPHDQKLLEEGRNVADQSDAVFITNKGQELSAGFAVEFLHKCWFRRFTSWEVQNVSHEVRRGKKQARALPDRPTFRSVTPTSLPPPPPPPTNRHSVGNILEHRVDATAAETQFTSSTTLPHSPVKPAFLNKGSFEESDIYSNPVEQKLGKKATLERKKKSSLPVSPPFLSPPHVPSPVGGVHEEESDYACAEDALKLSDLHAGMVDSLKRQPRRSPSMSPPPPPFSPPLMAREGEEERGPELEYDTVDISKVRTLSPTGKGYDHLQGTDETTPTKGYDHLNPSPPRPPRTDLSPQTNGDTSSKYASPVPQPSSRSPAPTQPSDTYDSLDEREGPEYATIEVCKPKKKPAPPPVPTSTIPNRSPSPVPKIYPRTKPHPPVASSPADNMYSVVNKQPRHQRMKSDDLTLHSSMATPSNVDQMYSVVQKPRPQPKPRRAATPEEPMYSVPERKPPPPLAPKPTSRSPTPTHRDRKEANPVSLKVPGQKGPGFSHMRSESFDTGLINSASSPLRQDLRRTGRSNSLNQQRKINMSPLAGQRSPSPEIKTFSSLPSSYRNRANIREVDIQRTRSKEELPQHKRSPKLAHNFTAAVAAPVHRVEPSEVEWEEDAPPVPERNYSWSDIEDNDDEIFQSDDDLDEPMSEVSIMEHQQLYSTIRRLSIHTPNSIEAIYNVVNRIHIPPTSNRDSMVPAPSHSQWLPPEQEQVYDTLESIVSNMSQPAVPTPQGVATLPSQSTQSMESLPLTPRDIKLIKQQQKLLQKLQKKAEKEAELRRRQEEKKKKREEEQLRKEKKRKGRKGKSQKPAANEPSRYFGSCLASVMGNDGVPAFVHKCVAMIEAEGMESVGLYRVSGKKEDCLALQDKYDQDPAMDITPNNFSCSCISSTLKAFFKLLPEPIIPNEVASQLLVINSLDVESQRTRIHEILSKMPHSNLCTFRFIMNHLHKVQALQEVNKMSASNLAIVFWPTLIRPPLMDLADSSKQMGWQLVMTRIIEHPDFVPAT